MNNDKYLDLAAVLPHRPPMILIDRIISYDVGSKTLTAEFSVNERSLFFDAALGGIPAWVGLEYMAQAMAALTGILAIEGGGAPPAMGFVLGTRKYSNEIGLYRAGGTYTVDAESLFFDGSMGGFKCVIRGLGGASCATAEISAFAPEDAEAILLGGTDG